MSIEKLYIVEYGISNSSFLEYKKSHSIVFKEEFYKGEVTKNVGSDEFWKKRYDYAAKKGVSKLEYFDSVIKPLMVLQDVSCYKEVVLCFYAQKNSQINARALLTYLLTYYKKDVNYYLITIDKKTNDTNKTKLSRKRLLEAQKQWEAFVREI